jgi:uncharacterized membrane protein YcaP (DUF421 family)
MEVVYRALFVFAFLWFITRVTGRSTLGELSTFDLLLYVTMGDLIQQAVTQQDYSITSAVLAIGVFALLTVALSFINSRSRKLRPLTHGRPLVVVDKGEPVMANLRSERLSIDDVMAAARSDGIERFGQIKLGVLEANGQLSFFTGEAESGAANSPPEG